MKVAKSPKRWKVEYFEDTTVLACFEKL